MANQHVLSCAVDVTNTAFGPAQAASALGAYPDLTTDPVLGQKFVFPCTRGH